MINSQQAFNVERTWAIAMIATAIAGIAYGFTAWSDDCSPRGHRG